VAEIIARAKAEPDYYTYASAGVGNGSHLFMALLEQQAKISMVHVPYRSGSETVTAVMRGDAQFCFPTLSSALQMIRAGQLRAVAMGGPATEMMPGVPPISDTLPGFDVSIWYGFAAPPGMDPELADRINAVLNQIAVLPEIRKAVADTQGGTVIGGSRQAFADFLQAEHARWTPVIRQGGIRVE
jgi:tripartite-type tricarboxylate transporter receptor subunit TctC